MAEHHEISVYLTSPQFLKYRKGLAFQLTNAQLQADSGKHLVDIHLSKKLFILYSTILYDKRTSRSRNRDGFFKANYDVIIHSVIGTIRK